MAEAEMAKMMDKYAKLLGHQNQKQKIQYISKLKDEYMQCRKVGLGTWYCNTLGLLWALLYGCYSDECMMHFE